MNPFFAPLFSAKPQNGFAVYLDILFQLIQSDKLVRSVHMVLVRPFCAESHAVFRVMYICAAAYCKAFALLARAVGINGEQCLDHFAVLVRTMRLADDYFFSCHAHICGSGCHFCGDLRSRNGNREAAVEACGKCAVFKEKSAEDKRKCARFFVGAVKSCRFSVGLAVWEILCQTG